MFWNDERNLVLSMHSPQTFTLYWVVAAVLSIRKINLLQVTFLTMEADLSTATNNSKLSQFAVLT